MGHFFPPFSAHLFIYSCIDLARELEQRIYTCMRGCCCIFDMDNWSVSALLYPTLKHRSVWSVRKDQTDFKSHVPVWTCRFGFRWKKRLMGKRGKMTGSVLRLLDQKSLVDWDIARLAVRLVVICICRCCLSVSGWLAVCTYVQGSLSLRTCTYQLDEGYTRTHYTYISNGFLTVNPQPPDPPISLGLWVQHPSF